jgi:hypothetical protein
MTRAIKTPFLPYLFLGKWDCHNTSIRLAKQVRARKYQIPGHIPKAFLSASMLAVLVESDFGFNHGNFRSHPDCCHRFAT